MGWFSVHYYRGDQARYLKNGSYSALLAPVRRLFFFVLYTVPRFHPLRWNRPSTMFPAVLKLAFEAELVIAAVLMGPKTPLPALRLSALRAAFVLCTSSGVYDLVYDI
jgi:hypothetical protein